MATKKRKPVTLESLDESIRDLGGAMTQGFERVEKKLSEHDQRFEAIDRRFEGQDLKLGSIHQDVRNLTVSHNQLFKQVQRIDDQLADLILEVKAIRKELKSFPSREEYETLNRRLLRVEQHLGLAE